MVTAKFVPLARIVARGKGIADAPLVVLPADFEQSPHDVMLRAVDDALEQLEAIFESRRT